MPWTAAAIVGGAVIGAVATNGASNKQSGAANHATDIQQGQYQQTRADNLPALGARNDALARLEQLLGVGGDSSAPGFGSAAGSISPQHVESDPGYQFGLQQGQQALKAAATARGMSDSGAALKEAARFGTDYATTKYDDAFNRQLQDRQQQLNPFLSLAGAGQVGTSQIGAAGQQFGQLAGNNALIAGNASAQGLLGQASIYANAGNQLAGWYDNQQRQPSPGYTAGGSWASNQADNIDAGGGWNPSDVRLKRDLRAVGMSPRGYTVYDWIWRDSGAPGRGVVAQEVGERDPSAVRVGANGFLEVNYSKV